MNEDVKKQIQVHYERYLKALEDSKKSLNYAEKYDHDLSNIGLARQLRNAAKYNENKAYKEFEICKFLEFDNCSHIWYLSTSKKDVHTPLYCPKCGLHYKNAPRSGHISSRNFMLRTIGKYLLSKELTNYIIFSQYALCHGTYTDEFKDKEMVEKAYKTISASNPNPSDEFLVEYIDKLYLDYSKSESEESRYARKLK